MALPNITNYAKNVAKSIVYTAVDVAKSDMPTLAAYIDQDSNRELSRSIYAGVKDYKGTITKTKAAIKNSKIYEAAELGVKSAVEDIKTGKFYNKERIDAIEEKTIEMSFGSFDDMDLDFNFDSGDPEAEITSGDRLVAASTHVAAYKAADMVAQTQIKTTDALLKSQKASTNALLLQSAQVIGGLKEVAFVGAQTQGALVNLNKVQEAAAQNQKIFYENTTKMLQESNAMMKEMLDMQRALYKSSQQQEKQKEKTKPGYDDVVDYQGVIDFKQYFGNVKANAKSTLSSKTGGMSDFFSDQSNMLNMFASSPLQFMSEALLRAFMPTGTKNAAKDLDKTLSGVASTILARFNNMAKNDDNPIMQMIGQIFGVKSTTKTSLDPSKFTKGPVPFDGVVRKSIVDVIPTYLRRIEAALTGQPEKVFDMTKGSWTDMRRIKSEYDQMFKSARGQANYDLVAEIKKVLNDKNAPKYRDRYSNTEFTKSLETFLNAVYDNDGDFRFTSKEDAWKYGINEDDFALIADIISNKNNKSMRRARINHSGEVMSSKSSLNKRFEQLEQLADSPLFQLFNKSTDSKLEVPDYEEPAKAFGGVLDINKQKDDLGHNLFFYMRNMYNELYTIRNFYGAPAMAAIGGKPFMPPTVKPLNIPDVHERTAREKYNASQEEANRRYDAEIAKHVSKGGALYDLLDNRGNILKNRATVEQREILEQLEASRASNGWINDILYGDSTYLDKANSKRSKEGQDSITGKRFTDRMKGTSNLSEKFAVIQDQINKITSAPDKLAKSLLQKADERIYSFFYADETGEETSTGEKVKGFMQLMSIKLNTTFDKINDFIDTKIFDPIKQKLGVENMKDLMDKIGVTDVWNRITDKLFGEKDSEGKRQGGIFGDVREEIKSTFTRAKDYVFDSVKEVFSPITTRVQAAFANRPKVTTKDINPADLTDNILTSLKPDVTPLNALYIINPEEAINRLKKEISESLKAHNLPCSELVLECTSKTDSDYIYKQVSSVASRMSGPDADAIRKSIESKFKRLGMFFKGQEAKAKAGRSVTDIANANKQSYNATQDLISTRRPGENYRDSTTALNDKAKKDPLISPIEKLCREAGVSPNSKEGRIINDTIRELLKSDPNYDPNHPARSLNNIPMSAVYDAINSAELGNRANAIKKKMLNKYGNQDIPLNAFITGGKAGLPISGGPNIFSKVGDTLDKILSIIKSVTTGDTVRVEVTRKVRTPSQNTPSARILSHVGMGRESETEGDSTGDSDGELHSSAFGNSFKRNSLSALSEGELYSRNGLIGKVPSTGVYSVKSGTTIYPTKKDKAIELAKEQSVISKFLAKSGITSNAAANNAPSIKYEGKTYILGDDGKYHNYEIVDGVTKDHILESGFIDQMYSTAKGGLNSFLTGLGFNGIANSNTIDNIDSAMEVVKKYAPKMTAHGLLGAAVGVLSGNPLLGAAIGATSGYINASEKAKNALLGEEFKDADGNTQRKGGIISKQTQDTLKKYLPNMGKYGVTGAVLSLVTPLGLVGGALMGSAIGWGVTDDKIKEALFGNLKDSTSGLISKDFRDQVKKAAPNIAIGAIGGMLAGPFGLMGNLVLGSGIGLASSTEGFKNFLLGEEVIDENGNKTRKGGLTGAIKVNVVDPLKDFASTLKGKTEDFVINDLINPLKEGIKPVTHEMALLTKGLVGFVPKLLNRMFESTFGRPLQDLIRDRIVAPVAAAAGFAGRVTGGIGKAVISAPFKAFGAVGRGLQSKHIRKGDANYISAEERLAFRDENRGRGMLSNIPLLGNSVFGSLGMNPTGYRDKFRGVDETLAGITDPEQLKAIMEATESLSKKKGYFKEQTRKTGRAFMAELSAVFPSSTCGRIKKALEAANLNLVARLIRNEKPVKGVELSVEQREALIKKAEEALVTIEQNKNKANLDESARSGLYSQLQDMGFSNIGEKNIGKLYDLVKTEYGIKKKSPEVEAKEKADKEEKDRLREIAVDPITENASENANKIIEALTESLKNIEDLQLRMLPPGEREQAIRAMGRRQEARANNILSRAGTKDGTTIGEDKNTKWEFKDGRVRKYIKTSDGWEEAQGKVKADADRDEMEEQEQQTGFFASKIGSKLLDIFSLGKTDKETGDKKENPLVSLLKKAAKVAGIGLLGATAVAGTGHAATYMSTTGIPFIKSLWDERMKPFLQNHLGEFYDKISDIATDIRDFVTGVPGRIKNTVTTFGQWFTGSGDYLGEGLPYIFENKIFPWYLEGFHGFATKFLPPLVKTIVVSLPSIASGIVKGVYEGIKSLFKINDRKTAPEFNTDYGSINTSMDEGIYSSSSSALGKINPVSGGSKWWGGTSSGLSDVFSIAKSGMNVTIPASGADRDTRNANRDALQANIDNSIGGAKRSYINQAIDNAKEIRTSDGKVLYNYQYMPTDTLGNHYDKYGNVSNDNASDYLNPFDGVRSFEDRLFTGGVRWASGAKVMSAPFGALKGAGKLTQKLGLLGYLPGKAMEGIGRAGEKILPHSPNLAAKVIGGDTLKEAAMSNSLLSKVVKVVTNGLEKVFKSDTVINFATDVAVASGKVMDTAVMRKLLQTNLGRITAKFTTAITKGIAKATPRVLSRIATTVSIPVLATAGFAVYDFITGTKNARDIFGLTKNQDITLFERFIGGLLKVVSGLCMGLIKEDMVIDIFIDCLAPILNINTDEINERRAQAEAEVQAYNAEMGLDLTIEQYNHKDGLWTKVKAATKKAVGGIGTGISTFYQSAKEKGLGTAIKDSAIDLAESAGKALEDKFGEDKLKSILDLGTHLSDIFKYTKEGSPVKLMGVGKGNGITSILTFPVKSIALAPAAVVGAIKGVVNFVSPILKSAANTTREYYANNSLVTQGMLNGDIKEMLLAGNSFVNGEGNLDLSQLVSNAATIPTKLLYIAPTLVIGGFKQIFKAVKPIVQNVMDEGSNALTKLGSVGSFILNGDVSGLIGSVGDIRNEEGNLSAGKVMSSVLIGASIPFTILPTLAIGAFKKVGEAITPLVNGIVEQANTVVEDQSNLKKLASNADVVGVLGYKPVAEDGPLSFLHKSVTFVSKSIYGPMAAFKTFGKTLDTLFKPTKEVSVKSMINEMWEYTNKKKHPDMTGFDNIGRTGDGLGDVINNTIGGIVRGIGEPIVKTFRAISGISDLVKKLKGDAEEQAEEVNSKYGTGRFFQRDPRISGIPFNKAGDTIPQTIGDSGCGPIAAVNAVNYAYGTGANPISASKMALSYKEKNGGTNPKFFMDYFNRNGLSGNRLHGTGQILNSIKSGSPVVLMGKDRYANGDSPYGPNPHYIVGKGVDANGNIIVDDPESISGSKVFPASKVLGKSNVAISASRYGRGKYANGWFGKYDVWYQSNGKYFTTTVNANNKNVSKGAGVNTNSGEWKIVYTMADNTPIYIKKSYFDSFSGNVSSFSPETITIDGIADSNGNFTSISQVIPKVLLFKEAYNVSGNNKVRVRSGSKYYWTDRSNIKAAAPAPTSGIEKVMANAGDFKRMQYTTRMVPTNAEKYKLIVPCLPYLDKKYSSIPSGVIDIINAYAAKTGRSNINQSATVRSVLIYLGTRPSDIETFAADIAKVTSLSLDELKKSDSMLYAKLREITKACIGADISSYGTKTVGEVCSSIGLQFGGDASESTNVQSGDSIIEAYNTDMTSYSESQQDNSSKSIFSVISDFFTGLFDYTDKDGNKRNLLNIFGIGPGSSSTLGGTTSSGFSGTADGLSPQQSKIKELLSSIIGKNNYDQGNRYNVDATLKGASRGSADCSSTVQWALKTGAGVDPGGDTGAQIDSKLGQWVDGPYEFGRNGNPSLNNLAVGDLMFYGKSGSSKSKKVSHVEMYWGDGNRIGHGSGIGPRVSPYTAKGSSQQYLGAKRFIPIGSIAANTTGTTTAAGGSVEQNKATIWKFLKSKGYSDIAAAGIMGNIEQECGFRHDLVEGNGKGPGVGICQWTYHTRKKAFLAAVPDWKTNLGGQLDFMWKEINQSYKGVLPDAMNKCTTVTEAVWLFHQVYEGSADIQRTGGLVNRENYGAKAYSQFASTGGTTYGTGKYGMAASNIVRNGQITSRFDDPTRLNHKGIDISGQSGQSIISPARGIVIRSEYNETNGNMIVIQSEDGYLYTFCHMSSRNAKVGDRVSIGTILGKMGSTGNSFGDHVHYQVTNADGQFVDPLSISNTRKSTSAASPAVSQRAIGGSDGIDYTQLIKIIIELLGTISDNTSKFAKALNIISEKTGADLSGIDLSTKDKALSQIKDKLRNLDSSYGKGSSDLGASLIGTNTDYLIKTMSVIAQS